MRKKQNKIRLPEKNIKILLMINTRWWNAEAAYAFNLARSLREQNHSVWLLTPTHSPVEKKAREAEFPLLENIYLNNSSPFKWYYSYKRLKQFIQKEKIMVVNTFQSQGSLFFWLLRKRLKNFYFLRTRGDARAPRVSFLNAKLYGKEGCDGIVYAGNSAEKLFVPLKLERQSTKVIHYASSPILRPASGTVESWKKKWNLPTNKIIYCLLGRNQAVKGHIDLLKAFAQFSARNDAYLLFLIKDLNEFPENLKELKHLIKTLNLKEQSKICGFTPDLSEIIHAIDFGVIPSKTSEINCRVAVEFFSASIPVIAYPTGTLPEIIVHEQNGYLCSDKSIAALRDALDWSAQQKNEIMKLKKNACSTYKNKFTLQCLQHETINFWRSLSSPSTNEK